jgi:hypothetical protein
MHFAVLLADSLLDRLRIRKGILKARNNRKPGRVLVRTSERAKRTGRLAPKYKMGKMINNSYKQLGLRFAFLCSDPPQQESHLWSLSYVVIGKYDQELISAQSYHMPH